MLQDTQALIDDMMSDGEIHDVPDHAVSEWVALWDHTNLCGYCDSHSLCGRGKRLAEDLNVVMGTLVEHALVA